MNNKTLQAITDQHQAMKPFAELFCGQRLQYLQALVKSIDVIKWLKKETKGITGVLLSVVSSTHIDACLNSYITFKLAYSS